MTIAYDPTDRRSRNLTTSAGSALGDRFDVIKNIGDGSFGSVALARVRSAGSNVARPGTIIAIKTMKKSFDSFAPCLELREVVFLKTLPSHQHLVPALDIFLDPFSKKLHICMEYMEENLYQLMKARDHKALDGTSVKSILFQIMQGLEHIHAHNFFHRDIKPENILVSTSCQQESGISFRRHSTAPSGLPSYTVKIADFGLARETHSKLPYTTYVSTRWYRAPEVLLRAGEYSAPVDIWAVGAMAVEIATLKPLFPGGNEVDQVWRVCEIMGSPGNWFNKRGERVGGGDWREGTKLAGKLGFSFPKMAPHPMDTILQAPQWPASLSDFVTRCLMWDPKNRPTSSQALEHEYFVDAIDPLRPKSSASKIIGRKNSDLGYRGSKDSSDYTSIYKPSWFRKSLINRSDSVTASQQQSVKENVNPKPQAAREATVNEAPISKPRAGAGKRTTWNIGPSNVAPMPILPTIRPVSPLSDTVTAQASNRSSLYSGTTLSGNRRSPTLDENTARKIGRQLSVASTGNHYETEIHRQQAERALNGNAGLASPPGSQKESFFSFSHLRKRARRFSGRHQAPISPSSDDIEAQAGCGPWASNRSSMVVDPVQLPTPAHRVDRVEVPGGQDRTLRMDQSNFESPSQVRVPTPPHNYQISPTSILKRHHSLPQQARSVENLGFAARSTGPISGRTRRAQAHGVQQYETPEEEDELLVEALTPTHPAMKRVGRSNDYLCQVSSIGQKDQRTPLRQSSSNVGLTNPYPTPSPSASGSAVLFGQNVRNTPAKRPESDKHTNNADTTDKWPTPPYEEEWAESVTDIIWKAGSRF